MGEYNLQVPVRQISETLATMSMKESLTSECNFRQSEDTGISEIARCCEDLRRAFLAKCHQRNIPDLIEHWPAHTLR